MFRVLSPQVAPSSLWARRFLGRSLGTWSAQCCQGSVVARLGDKRAAAAALRVVAVTSRQPHVRQYQPQCQLQQRWQSSVAHHEDEDETIIPYLLADIGEGIKEVELLQWYVQPGDEVHEFDTICQVQSDKATVDITSRYHGVVTSLGAPVGEMIQVGTPLLFLQTDGASPHINVAEPSSTDNAKSSPTNTRSSSLADQMAADAASSRQDERLRIPSIASHYDLEAGASGASPRKVLTSPAVRKLAADHQIDLNAIKGTGPSGRILKYDVVQYLRQQGLMDSGVEGTVAATMKPSLPTPSTLPPSTILSEPEIIELKGYHRYMVQTMTQALQIPHMTLGDEVILDEILALRKRLGDKNDDTSPNISILAFMLKACSLALSEFPILNASIHSLERCELKIHREHHLGVAMDTPRGLVVPAVQNVQAKSLVEIQAELDQLKQHARIGQIDASVLNPTFTLSNVGALGVGQTMSAVLATPQVAMGAVGRLQRVPRFVSPDALDVQAVHVANVSWTGDHRVLDGATLAKFHKSFAAFLQDPVQMLVHTR